jgi:16S rRNA (cytosine1402-N4)-methyltransferase
MTTYHSPVLLGPSIEALNLRKGGTYVDLTMGGGGHSAHILSKLEGGRLFGFDQDPDAWDNAPNDPRFTLIRSNFRYARNFLRLHGALPVDGVLADLGVSSHQFDEAARGFSIRADGPLDMRMDPSLPVTAGHLVNTATAAELARMMREHSDMKEAMRVAQAILRARGAAPITTINGLIEALGPVLPKQGRSTFLARVFQALRMEVNEETAALREMLDQMPDVIARGGRLVVISYHSVEDRLAKDLIRSGSTSGKAEVDPVYGTRSMPFKDLLNGVTVPDDEEIDRNPRARSAKMRVAQRN